MAVVVVTADNVRVDDAEAIGGWSGVGGGAGASSEDSFPYQDANCVNRKITSATGAGFYYEPTADAGSAIDMTVSNRKTLMVKSIVTDYRGLDGTDGVLIRIGSATGAYYAFVIAGTDSPSASFASYKSVGGYLVVAIDPNENATYNDVAKDAGSPSLTAVDYFGGIFAFISSTAKSENCGIDALDIGSGLYLVGGDAGSTEGVWQDFADNDEGVVANRYGYARNGDGGTILALGNFRIGTDDDSTSTATEFTDRAAVVIWLDHLAGAGFSVVSIDLGDVSTVVADEVVHIGIGTADNVDSRPDYIVTGTSGSLSKKGTMANFRNITFTSAVTVLDAALECVLLTQSSCDISASTITTRSLTNVATLQDPIFGTTTDLHDVTFVQGQAGHAIEINVAGSYDLTNLFFSGYGGTGGSNLVAASGPADAAIVNLSGGAVTLNIDGGDLPSIRNGAGATTTVASSVAISVTAIDEDGNPIEGAVVLLRTAGDIVLNGLTNSSGVLSGSFSGTVPVAVVNSWITSGSGGTPYQDATLSGNITSNGFDATGVLAED